MVFIASVPVSLASQILRLVLDKAGDQDAVQDCLGGGGHHVAGDAGRVFTAHNPIVAHHHWFWNKT